ncbi:hypothetical protein F511_32044 [Dorcoceras hygrometricum]|uniref:Uncharacterized protein n=1 Tax=Dorcoceras hygrometricum TaxID=472368 RepID=A0A2Z7AHI7_9LAMI|nr:hypothetical protein F511_32044 [Dorcoceras hygrometricum]
MKMEFRLLHDIVAKALCEKARSFDMVTSEKFDLMVAISAGLKADLGESVKLHPQKALTSKSVLTYVKKNLKVIPAGESSKQTEDTASDTEGGESHIAQPVGKETRAVEKKKKNQEKGKKLAELINHLKETGDAKKGEGGGQGSGYSGPREGPRRQGEGPSSTRGKGPSHRRGEGSSSYKISRWF